jgi:hypothetical protein
MAFYRTALRLATIESLRPAALLNTQGPWPTLAGARVFDTRLDPFDDIGPKPKAAIAVYTEADPGYAGQRRGGPPYRREVDLVFEISQIAKAQSDSDPSVYVAGVPLTDPELEAELDRIETEISLALMFNTNGITIRHGGETKPLWRALTGRMVTEPRSMPHRTSEESERLAMRTVTWKTQVPDDLFEIPPPADVTGLDRLPEPLRAVAKALENTPGASVLLKGLAGGMPTMAPAVLLDGINVNAELLRPGQARTGNPNLSAAIAFPTWTWRNR